MEKISKDRIILTWLVRHVASMHNRHHVGTDGRTPWERVAGRRSEGPSTDFGQRVMFMTKGPKKEGNWSLGVWLGLVAKSEKLYMVTKEGTMKAWSVRRAQARVG